MARAWGLLLAIGVILPTWLSSTKVSSLIERISDPKDLKKLLRTRNNVLVLYSESDCLCCCRLCQGQEPRPVSAGVREGLPHLPLLPLWEACRKV
ncbi:protein disulfide isomerase-associated 5, isoform CRA_c [Rattus norvegicus]|uniref:Protein disulfide isomerase-associated 5, isoform CRA_c n=1 Tax=Rattus norvegicus TaxID=10116 RepID=A6IRG3_RAT|nr:protein disulfide isomerase-associated 5, isoform CRA_c [Rattus norvegicus]